MNFWFVSSTWCYWRLYVGLLGRAAVIDAGAVDFVLGNASGKNGLSLPVSMRAPDVSENKSVASMLVLVSSQRTRNNLRNNLSDFRPLTGVRNCSSPVFLPLCSYRK